MGKQVLPHIHHCNQTCLSSSPSASQPTSHPVVVVVCPVVVVVSPVTPGSFFSAFACNGKGAQTRARRAQSRYLLYKFSCTPITRCHRDAKLS